MSGICGVVGFGEEQVEDGVVQAMAAAASQRGVDGIGYWSSERAALAHLALHITAEDALETQPLTAGELVLVADARIDNRRELIAHLGSKGLLACQCPTDGELILAAYRCWGTACAGHLIGDFAFALWDQTQRRFFAARDPMAMRAFYYRLERGRLLFATEVKQILAAPNVPKVLFEPMVGAYLTATWGELSWTFYEGIHQLEPGHALLVEEGKQRVWRTWDVDPAHRIRYRTEAEYAEHFRELFVEAVRCRLRSSKPVGLFLSGGMDSSCIAATAGWLQGQGETVASLHTYSWAFEELTACDERHISDQLVRHYGLASTPVPADDAWPLKNYPTHGPHQDEPFIGVYQALFERTLALAQREGRRLMLSGDRGDLVAGEWPMNYPELLWGGQWSMLWAALNVYARWHHLSLPQTILKKLIYAHWPQDNFPVLRRLVRSALGRGPQPLSPPWLRDDFAHRIDYATLRQDQEPPTPAGPPDWRWRYQMIFAKMHLRGMAWSERSNAHFGQGFADPWSDRRLAAFVLAIPQQVLNPPGAYKQLAHGAMDGILPCTVGDRVSKIVPTPLYQRALREKAQDTIWHLLTDMQAAQREYVDEWDLRQHYEDVGGGANAHYAIWYTLTLEMWLRQYWR